MRNEASDTEIGFHGVYLYFACPVPLLFVLCLLTFPIKPWVLVFPFIALQVRSTGLGGSVMEHISFSDHKKSYMLVSVQIHSWPARM